MPFPLLICYTGKSVRAAHNGDCPADVFVDGLQTVVVAGARSVGDGDGRSVVVLCGEIAIDEDAPGKGVEEGVYPPTRGKQGACDAEEDIGEVDACHRHHAAEGDGKL